jgi:Ser/Thr protein kinase RdoA (MazF antagonist)
VTPETTAAVADAFGLGTVTQPPAPVTGGLSHLLFRVETTGGTWAVKQLNRSREDWWLADYLVAADVELAAHRHGIALPRPVPPREPAAPLLADLPVGPGGAPVSFLVRAWVDGTPLPDGLPHAAPVLEWAGRTLAALHALPLAASPPAHGPHPAAEWAEWLAGAPADVPASFPGEVAAFLPDVARAHDLVTAALAARPAPVLTHRDVRPDNVLLTPAGPVLVDWDGAGPDYPDWETARTALAFAGLDDREAFRRVLRAYAAAGGHPVPAAPETFAGMIGQQLGGAAFLLWRALGHRPATPAERTAAYAHTLTYLTRLRASLTRLDTWTTWPAAL